MKKTDEFDVLGIIKSEIKDVESTLREVDQFYQKDLRRLDKLSDRIAHIGGSWNFILSFLFLLFLWVIINAWIFVEKPFDPYPFILLNLILSTLAALQAPLILMSQNRAAKRDQARMELDLEKDLRDLHIDQGSHRLLLELRHDLEKVKKKMRLK